MTARPINPTLKAVLEFGPALAFFALYTALKDRTFALGGTDYSGFIVATAAFVPVALLAMLALWKLAGRISRMQVVTAVMVVFFGGLTVWFNDAMFFKMKTTIVYGLFAVILYVGLLMGRSWLEYVMGELLPMRRDGWMILTRRLAMAFSFLAVANEIVWRTMSEQTWVTVETFGFPVALFLFLWAQIMQLQPYMVEDRKTKVE